MKAFPVKRVLAGGITCGLLMAASSWYSVVFNDSRLVVPMDFSTYTFRVQDLPMIFSIVLLAFYFLDVFILFVRSVFSIRRRQADSRSTRAISPKLGFLGLLGFSGFLGFWTYSVDKTIFPFMFFVFFGYFGFFYEGKMANTLMDERYRENRMRAHMEANRVSLSLIFLSTLILGQGRFMSNLEYTLIAFLIVVSLSIALGQFLSEYLLYRYDHDEPLEEGGE